MLPLLRLIFFLQNFDGSMKLLLFVTFVFLMIMQASKPRVVVKLWKCQIEQPKLNQADPSIIIFDKGTSMYHVLVFNLQISQVNCLFVILATCLLI